MCVFTRVVEQGLGFSSVLGRRDELPDEALDVLVAAVMQQAEHQDDTADGLYVPLAQTPLAARMRQDVPPAPPPGGSGRNTRF